MPAWNEEECVADTIREVMAKLPSAYVVVVDDGSADRTAEVAAHQGPGKVVILGVLRGDTPVRV